MLARHRQCPAVRPGRRTAARWPSSPLTKPETIDADGGPVQPVCDVPNSSGNPGAAWNRAGMIVLPTAHRPPDENRLRLAGNRPRPRRLTPPTATRSHAFPTFLPAGRRFPLRRRGLRARRGSGRWPRASRRVSLSSDSQVLYSIGYLLFAAPGDAARLIFRRTARRRSVEDPTVHWRTACCSNSSSEHRRSRVRVPACSYIALALGKPRRRSSPGRHRSGRESGKVCWARRRSQSHVVGPGRQRVTLEAPGYREPHTSISWIWHLARARPRVHRRSRA